MLSVLAFDVCLFLVLSGLAASGGTFRCHCSSFNFYGYRDVGVLDEQ